MSFDIFMCSYINRKSAFFRRSLLHEIFGSDANLGNGKIYSIRYNALDGAQVYGADEENMDHLMFNHFGGERFMDGFWRLADRTNSIIFWPSRGPVGAVTRAEILKHVDPEMLGGFSEVRVVNNVQELGAFIGETG